MVLFGSPVTFVQVRCLKGRSSSRIVPKLTGPRSCTAALHAQLVGYSIALVGLFVFKTSPEVLAGYIAQLKALVGR